MAQTSCVKLLFASEVTTAVKAIESANSEIRAHEIPSQETLLNSHITHSIPVPQYSQVQDDPIVILHSSGSTGKCMSLAQET
jgi:acyl-coenzyme A synthetase/AMP-(fatty) acid ligase